MRVLFILKNRETAYSDEGSSSYSYGTLESGLYNSANFVTEMLNTIDGFEAKIVSVEDNNSIDREVTAYRPDVVIIEAFWVVPEKFEILSKLHPKVKWVIRNHSKLPFLANEGIAMGWSMRYVQYPNVYLSSNSVETNLEMAELISGTAEFTDHLAHKKTPLLTNFYPYENFTPATKVADPEVVDIGCFGAVRPLKNHLLQATAAIKYAKQVGKKLRFHINATRIEGKGDPVLKNLRELFEHQVSAELVEHSWMKHAQFVELLADMDLLMQVSYTETFNIVAADAVSVGVPVVTSDEIEWTCPFIWADPNCSDSMVRAIKIALQFKSILHLYNQWSLEHYSNRTKNLWVKQLTKLATY